MRQTLPASLQAIALASLLLAWPTLAATDQPDATLPSELSHSAQRWVKSSLSKLSLQEKAAQLVMVRVSGFYQNPRSKSYQQSLREVRDRGVGGVVVFASEVESLPRILNDLQAEAKVPLLVSADLERSLAFRVRRGTVSIPYAMAIGATRSIEAAQFTGEVTAREGRALGIHWALAPVADVSSNPDNPVINIRSYGEDPQWVARLSEAFVRGVKQGGMMTTAKHFPGHGDTATDSHLERPVITADRARLEQVELVPFRADIAAGVDAVMPGHIAVPALDPSETPATLSAPISTDLLRREMGFEGLIITDGLDMEGVRPAWAGEAAVGAVKAGADVLLLPPDSHIAIQSLVRAVREGELSEERIDTSVRRILEAKARLGLHRDRVVSLDELGQNVARPEDVEQALDVASESITVVRNNGNILPLRAEKPLRLLHLVISSNFSTDRGISNSELEARRIPTTTHVLGPEVSPETFDEILAGADEYTHILVSAFIRVASDPEESDLSPAQTLLLDRLNKTGAPLIVVSYGSPYLLAEIPETPVFVCTYGAATVSQRAAIAALFGETAVGGKLPITLSDLYPIGHGVEIPRHEMTLESSQPEKPVFQAFRMESVDRVLDEFLQQQAFPGGVLAVGYRGALVHLKPFGRLSYDESSPPVTADTIYDLASLTKVVATTTMAMILVDSGALDLDKPVHDFLPLFRGPSKEKVTVRNLLTHSSGLVAYGDLYTELDGKTAYIEHIQTMDLDYEPGSKSVYSDYGMILLGEILERVAGQPMDEFLARRVFKPLGMKDTGYLPAAATIDRIAPTEDDPWRGYLVRGEVHDENAHAMGGVAPHAGLFSTATDLARYLQMILNGGVLEHQRIVSPEIAGEWTQRAGIPDSDRAIGWDTKSAEKSSAGQFFSPRSFGHLGYTGTSMWVDPDRELFVILLTNRVHPTRENTLIRQARPAVADAVVQALEASVVQVGLERIAAGDDQILRGKRLGLVAHAASVTAEGRHAIDVLRDRGLNIVRVFSPEHGLRGRAAAGEQVADGVDPTSGLPVVSLYGSQRKPTADDLADLDTLVFDLQDAGVRFYTYVSTMMLCLEAAAEAGLEFVVLDRPNPLGGDRVEGPLSDPRTVVPQSFVNMAPGPLVHGLTLGEVAQYVISHSDGADKNPARLTVIPMRGWLREMSWLQTGRPWVAPSPNLRSPQAALAYPGVALLEATNVSEGRGTSAPFLLLGAPWLDPDKVHLAEPGYAFEPASFTPQVSPAAAKPKYVDQECRGFQVEVRDAHLVQPYRMGLTLLLQIRQQPDFEWRRSGEALTWLVGTARLFEDLNTDKSIDEILAADSADHITWRAARKSSLLY